MGWRHHGGTRGSLRLALKPLSEAVLRLGKAAQGSPPQEAERRAVRAAAPRMYPAGGASTEGSARALPPGTRFRISSLLPAPSPSQNCSLFLSYKRRSAACRPRAPFQDKAPRVAPVSELSSRSRNAGAAPAGGAKPGLSLSPRKKGSEDEAGSQTGAARGENLRRLLAGAPRGAGIAESCSRAPAPHCRVWHPVMQKASV